MKKPGEFFVSKKDIVELIPKPNTKFIRVKCSGCGSEQTIFSAASTNVKCLACNQPLAQSGASKIKIKTKIINVYS